MRPTQQQCNINNDNDNPPLKVNKDSHLIKKSSSSSTSTAPLHRHPVIIYTHSPKIIHTHPRDFMALVQKLTGLSRSNDDKAGEKENGNSSSSSEENKSGKAAGGSDDNESSSVITTDENCGGNMGGKGQVNSCFVAPPIFEPPNPFLTSNIPLFTPKSADFLCSNQSLYNYTADSLIFPPNMRGSISQSSAAQGMNDFREF